MLKELIKLFIRTNGRKPNKLELLQLKFKAAQQSGKGQVIEFPRDKITDWTKPRPGETKVGEVQSGIMKATGSKPTAVKQIFMSDKDFKDLRRSFRMNIIKNDRQFNEDLAKQIINREIYTDLSKGQRKNLLDDLDQVFKGEQGLAGGGIAGMLGEPTYADENHRVPYKGGLKVYPKIKGSIINEKIF